MAKAPKKTPTPSEELMAGEGSVAAKTTTKSKAAPAKKPTAAQQKQILKVAPLPTDAINDTATAIENLKAKDALPLVSEMLNSNDFNEFKIGGVLSVIDANGYWREQGYDKFKDFIEGFYGINYRKAMYLINIYNSLLESGVEWDQVSSVGWTKLKEICGLLNTDNVDKWVELANSMSCVALQAYIKTCDENGEPKGGEGAGDHNPADTPDVSTMTFKVHNEQKTTVREALDKVKAEISTEHDNVALEHLANEYLQGTLGKKATGKPTKQKTLKQQVEDLHKKDPEAALESILGQVADLYPMYDFEVTPAEEAEGAEEE